MHFHTHKSKAQYIVAVSKQKLYKQGFQIFIEYWTDNINQQNIITKLPLEDYLYTQKRDKTGLFHVVIYNKRFAA